MKILLTLGATREPIDAVRFLSNRSSGKMGSAIAEAAMARGHRMTVIVAAITASLPTLPAPHPPYRRINVETARQMHEAVLSEFGGHDLLIMAAAVADYRPMRAESGKLPRGGEGGGLTIVCEPTEDILAAVAAAKRPGQRVVGFSLENAGDVERARAKMAAKQCDLMVFNPLATMDSPDIDATLLWPDGRREAVGLRGKTEMAGIILDRAERLMPP